MDKGKRDIIVIDVDKDGYLSSYTDPLVISTLGYYDSIRVAALLCQKAQQYMQFINKEYTVDMKVIEKDIEQVSKEILKEKPQE